MSKSHKKFLNQPEADLNSMFIETSEAPPEDPENCRGGLSYTKWKSEIYNQRTYACC